MTSSLNGTLRTRLRASKNLLLGVCGATRDIQITLVRQCSGGASGSSLVAANGAGLRFTPPCALLCSLGFYRVYQCLRKNMKVARTGNSTVRKLIFLYPGSTKNSHISLRKTYQIMQNKKMWLKVDIDIFKSILISE